MDSKTFVIATILFVSSPSFALNGSECKTAGALQEFRLQDDSFAGAVVKSRGADCDIVSVKTYIYECRAFNWKYTGQMGREVFVGSSVAIIPGVSVGDGACLGAGSVVVRDVPAGASVMGVPAREKT